MSSQPSDSVHHNADTGAILDRMIQSQKITSAESEKDESSERLASRDAVMAGIMAAVKEIKLSELFGGKTCVSRSLP
jgi:hypothetical protein